MNSVLTMFDGGTERDGGGRRNPSMTDHSPNNGSASSVSTHAIAETIHALLGARAPDASICPSEVARHLSPEMWRELMPAVRTVAAQLATEGALRITQGEIELSAELVRTGAVRGPIRLRRPHQQQ